MKATVINVRGRMMCSPITSSAEAPPLTPALMGPTFADLTIASATFEWPDRAASHEWVATDPIAPTGQSASSPTSARRPSGCWSRHDLETFIEFSVAWPRTKGVC
jgi:hypothetical protein